MTTTIKFLKKGIKIDGVYHSVWYSNGIISDCPKGTITIYVREYGAILPVELCPQNDSDYMTDYFDTDRSRIKPDSVYYKDVLRVSGFTQEDFKEVV
jgi:hypothetical protein